MGAMRHTLRSVCASWRQIKCVARSEVDERTLFAFTRCLQIEALAGERREQNGWRTRGNK